MNTLQYIFLPSSTSSLGSGPHVSYHTHALTVLLMTQHFPK